MRVALTCHVHALVLQLGINVQVAEHVATSPIKTTKKKKSAAPDSKQNVRGAT